MLIGLSHFQKDLHYIVRYNTIYPSNRIDRYSPNIYEHFIENCSLHYYAISITTKKRKEINERLRIYARSSK